MSCLTCALLWGLMLENSAWRACALYLSVSQMAACYCGRGGSGQLELLLDLPPVLNAFFHKCCISQSFLMCLHPAIDNPLSRQKEGKKREQERERERERESVPTRCSEIF